MTTATSWTRWSGISSRWLDAEQLAFDDAVESGDACLAALEATYPETGLVVSDLRMPGMSGAELFDEIHRRYPDVGCVLVTANTDLKQINRAVAASMMGLVQKPWDADALVGELDGAVASIDKMRASRKRSIQLSEQLEIAASFQRAYMRIEPPGDDRFHLDVLSRPAPGMHLTGDYHDFVCLSPDRFLIVVGDGAGAGLRPALLTAMMKIQLRSRLDAPRQILIALNQRLFAVLPRGTDVVATCVVGLVDLAAGTVTTARAGRDSLFFVSDDVVEAEMPTGPALGFDPEADYEERTYPLHAGTRLVMFTDGLYDRSPRDGSGFDLRTRGMEDLLRHAHGDPHFIDQLLRLITANRILNSGPVIPLFDDDVTILSFLIRRIGPR
jgi:sigma-B regulation protein RsbU (phosphoserine phosphatase)